MPLEVDANTKLSKALKLHPDVLEYIVSLNPHDFERLHNPLVRTVMPPRITLGRIARMTHTPIAEILERIHTIAGLPFDRAALANSVFEEIPANGAEKPSWADSPAHIVDLLASDERLDVDPIIPIFQAIKKSTEGEVILVKHKWEPQPLYDVWVKQQIAYFAEQKSDNEWWIYLRK